MKWSIVVSVVVCTWAGSLLATPVELAEAIPVAQTWMARRGRLCQPVSGRTYIAQNGVNRFHVVGMSGGGFVALAANDELEPVLAFSDGANVSCEPGSPLHALLSKHVQEDRPSVVDVLSKSADSSEGLLAWSSLDGSDRVGAGAAWRVLKKASGGNVLSSGASTSSTTIGVSSLSDVRRSPLVKSSWGQSQTTGWGYNCFNLYTPYGYPCGCAATAMAQLMRYHAYPSSKVASVTKTCRINGTKYLIETFGGIYDWEDMPLDPSWTMSETKLRAIGKLTVDCGISVNMSYTSGGSGADAAKVPSALRTVFQYKQVKSGTPGLSALKKILMANLDYAKPVILAISGDSADSGHAVIADGYGYDASGNFYTHLNMGWNGTADIWYRLPKFTANGERFTVIDHAFYNIFPKSTGNIVSGRVVDTKGLPVEGAIVSFGSTTAQSNANGIFAMRTSEQSGTLKAKKNGVSSSSKSVTVSGGVSSGTQLVLELAKVETLANALDNSSLKFTTGGSAKWFYQTAVSHDGTDAARSGAIGNSASSYLATTMSGRGWLCFWWKVDCEEGLTSSDYLKFYADNGLVWRFTGTGHSWVYHECLFTEDMAHTAKWVYEKDWSFNSGKDCGWVDRVQWKPAVRVLLDPAGGSVSSNVLYFAKNSSCGALPSPARPRHVFDGWYSTAGTRVRAGTWLETDISLTAHWTENRVSIGGAPGETSYETTAESPWYVEGGGVYRSGTLSHADTNSLIYTVSGPGLLRFEWRPSSEAGCDWGLFEVDGINAARISGVSNGYTQVEWPLSSSGQHVFRWNYAKDKAVVKGEDCLRVRAIGWHPLVNVVFDANGGLINGAGCVTNGFYAGLLLGSGACPVPVRPGYEFAGWFTRPEGGEVIGDGAVVPSKGGRFHAHWLNVVDLAKALDGPGVFNVTTGGTSQWFGETSFSSDGEDAARSGGLAAGQSNWLEVKTSGRGRLRFKWRLESASGLNGGRLLFRKDGGASTALTGVSVWTEQVVPCDEGEHVFRWTYEQHASEWRSDCAYLDQVVWEPSVPFEFTFEGDWSQEEGVWGTRYNARDVEGPEPTAQMIVEGPGQLSFDVWVGDDSRGMTFEWGLDGGVQGMVDAAVGRTNVVLDVREAGRHLVSWHARRMAHGETGGTGAWLDHLVWRSGAFVDMVYDMDGLDDESVFVPLREAVDLLWDQWVGGYELARWMTETGEKLPAQKPFTPEGNSTLVAQWRPASVWSPDGAFGGSGTRTYYGYVWNGTNVVGSLTVKTKKTAVTATLKIGSKSYTYTGGRVSTKTGSVAKLVCSRNKNALLLRLGAKDLEGTYAGKYEIHGARSSVPAVTYRRGWSISLGNDKVTGRLLLKIDSKGNAKIAGTTATGAKISANARVIVGRDYVLVPVVSGTKRILIRVSAKGEVTLVGSTVGEIVEAGATTRPVFTGWTSSANSMVGVAYSARAMVTELSRPVKFSATGVPAGLSLNKSTGALSGIPTRAGTFVTKIKATSTYNSKWYSYLTVTNRILSLPSWAKGTFSGVIENEALEDDGRGSLNMTIGSTGKMSGKALLRGTNWTLSAKSYSAASTTTGMTNLVAIGTATYVKTTGTKKVTSRTSYAFSVIPPQDQVWFDSKLEGSFGDLELGAVRSVWKDIREGVKATTLLSALRSRYTYTNESETVMLVLKPVVDAKTRRPTGQMTVTGTCGSSDAKRKISQSVPILYATDVESGSLRLSVIVHVPSAGFCTRIDLALKEE